MIEDIVEIKLCAIENTSINPFQVHRIRTGIAVEIPVGYYGRVIGRSGLSAETVEPTAIAV